MKDKFLQSLSFGFVILVLAIAFGCGIRPAQEKTLSSDQVFARYLAAQQKATTYRNELQLNLSVIAAGSQVGKLTLSASMKSAVDLANKKMQLDSDISLDTPAGKSDVQSTVYLLQNTLYTWQKPSETDEWTQRELSAAELQAIWDKQTGGQFAGKYVDALNEADSRTVEIQSIAGVACYVIQQNLDPILIGEVLNGALDLGLYMGQPETLSLSDVFQGGSISWWIHHETFELMRINMNASISTTQQGSKLEGHFNLDSRYRDYGIEMSIELPEEADNAGK